DRDRVLHGSETNIIVRNPDGGYSEAHAPISQGEAYNLTRHPQLDAITSNGAKVGRTRQLLSRWFADGQVPVPTAEEIEAAAHHGGTPAIEGGSDTPELESSETAGSG